MWELTDDKAFFSPIIWADGDATESWSNICFSFSLSVEIVLKADFKVKYTTKIVKKITEMTRFVDQNVELHPNEDKEH